PPAAPSQSAWLAPSAQARFSLGSPVRGRAGRAAMTPLQERPVVDVAMPDTHAMPHAAVRARALSRFRLTDAAFRNVTRAAAVVVLVILGGVMVALVEGAIPALRSFGFNF